MSHTSTQIRDALHFTLQGLASIGHRIYKHRTKAFNADTIPSLNLIDGGDAPVPELSDPKSHKVIDLICIIEIRQQVGTDEDLDEALQDIRAEVETALEADIELSGKALFLHVEDWEPELDDAEKRIGVGRLYVRVRYERAIGAPEQLL